MSGVSMVVSELHRERFAVNYHEGFLLLARLLDLSVQGSCLGLFNSWSIMASPATLGLMFRRSLFSLANNFRTLAKPELDAVNIPIWKYGVRKNRTVHARQLFVTTLQTLIWY
ncbi:unnamed protein product [Polarella glacialis]|uniref:Uncharacterized protein n=1 Tax=Polarella glacialis TaxID=89957 RepID=A0A813HTL4_POLGL|nr:unnamed protein product [Polarella glacialis]